MLRDQALEAGTETVIVVASGVHESSARASTTAMLPSVIDAGTLSVARGPDGGGSSSSRIVRETSFGSRIPETPLAVADSVIVRSASSVWSSSAVIVRWVEDQTSPAGTVSDEPLRAYPVAGEAETVTATSLAAGLSRLTPTLAFSPSKTARGLRLSVATGAAVGSGSGSLASPWPR